jgi:hypothetical protein
MTTETRRDFPTVLPVIPDGRYALACKIQDRDWRVRTGEHMDKTYARSLAKGMVEGSRQGRIPYPFRIVILNDLGFPIEEYTYTPI